MGRGADPARMATLVCEDVGSLLDAVAEDRRRVPGHRWQPRAAASRPARLAELRMAPPLAGGARFAYVTPGRPHRGAGDGQVLRRFVVERLRD
jgi:hypothetical protein